MWACSSCVEQDCSMNSQVELPYHTQFKPTHTPPFADVEPGVYRISLVCTQSTSSILEASSAAPSTSSSGGRSSSSPKPSSSSSMLKPSLIMRWIRPANCVGSSKLKPEVSKDVSKSNQIKSFTVLSDLSAAAFFFNSVMIECFGFTSMVFFETMYDVIESSRNAWAFMMRSMFADQPYSDVVSTHGESTIRELTSTFSTLSPR